MKLLIFLYIVVVMGDVLVVERFVREGGYDVDLLFKD